MTKLVERDCTIVSRVSSIFPSLGRSVCSRRVFPSYGYLKTGDTSLEVLTCLWFNRGVRIGLGKLSWDLPLTSLVFRV